MKQIFDSLLHFVRDQDSNRWSKWLVKIIPSQDTAWYCNCILVFHLFWIKVLKIMLSLNLSMFLCHFCKHNCYEVCVTPIYLVDLIHVSYLNYCDILFYLWPKQWVFLVYY